MVAEPEEQEVPKVVLGHKTLTLLRALHSSDEKEPVAMREREKERNHGILGL